MTTTAKQIRKMDDVALYHVARTNRRLLESARAKGDKAAVAVLSRTLREAEVEIDRREALEAA